jgi:uncharacterized protein (TIGR02246 family)
VRKRTPTLLAIIPLALLCTGCQTSSIAGDVEALNRLQKQVDSAIIAGATERYVALITDDAVLMPPNGAPVIGKDAIRLWNQAMFKQSRIQSYSSVDDEVVVTGDWAFRRARIDWTIASTAGGAPARDSGKYIIIYRRQADGSWRVARDIWNSNSQPRPTTTAGG